MTRPDDLGDRVARITILTVTGFLILVGAFELSYLLPYIGAQNALGTDLNFYRSVGERWLDTGQFYLPHQLTGRYVIETDVDVLYPPAAIPFLAALRWLPFPLYYAIPLAVIAFVVVSLRPAPWTWPVMLFLVVDPLLPRPISDVLYGNTNMWMVAAVAGGIRWGSPAVLVMLKPSLAPFALVGVRHRSWWIAMAVVVVASVFALDLWRQYFTAVRNSNAEWYWSLQDVPVMCLPIVAWVGRRDGGFVTLRDLLRARPSLQRGRAWLLAGR